MTSEPCWECGAPATEWHHVVPRSLGGTRTVPLCCACHDKAHHMSRVSGRGGLTARALQAKRARGERVGAVRYGFELAEDGRTEVPCASEQETIERARRLRAAGLSLREVARELEEEGHRGRSGARIGKSQVARILFSDQEAAP